MSRVTEAGGYVFVSNMPGVMLAIETASTLSIKKGTQHVHRKVRENLRGGGRSGKRYKKPGTNVYYTASAPGEYPAIQFNQLRDSVHWKMIGETGFVHTNVLHGAYLEDPKNTRPIGRRRWLKRTFDEEKEEVMGIIYGAGNPASRRWF